LVISQAAAHHHISTILARLGAANRTEAAVLDGKHNLAD
jgi:DNA-binding NarL/FixJ family response regulator